jgi:hypothetical protein
MCPSYATVMIVEIVLTGSQVGVKRLIQFSKSTPA